MVSLVLECRQLWPVSCIQGSMGPRGRVGVGNGVISALQFLIIQPTLYEMETKKPWLVD